MAYNPKQPRDPSGTETGGQWTGDVAARAAKSAAGLRKFARLDTKIDVKNSPTMAPGYEDLVIKQQRQIDKLEDEERESLEEYKASSSAINGVLRGTYKLTDEDYGARVRASEIKRHTKNLDSALSKVKVGKDCIVFRGLRNGNADELENLAPGDTFTSPTFVSTTAIRRQGWGWASSIHTGVVLEIEVPAEQNGICLDSESLMQRGENEILLPRNLTFRVLEAEHRENLTRREVWADSPDDMTSALKRADFYHIRVEIVND